jgi:hypothetical protein
MMRETQESVDGVLNYESDVGQRVENSFSVSTHEEAPNYLVDVGLAVVPAAKAGKAVLKPVSATVDKVGEKALQKVADISAPVDDKLGKVIKENAENQRTQRVEYDADNEAGYDVLFGKRQQRIAERQAYDDRMRDTSANTVNNESVDREFYENIQRTSEKTRPMHERNAKGALHTAGSKIAKGIKNILEEYEGE